MPKRFAQALSVAIAAWCASNTAQAETLLEIYQLAMDNAPQVKAAEANLQAGKEELPLARAGLLPKISGSYNYEDTSGNQNSSRVLGSDFVSRSPGDFEEDTETYRLSLTQPVFDLPVWFNFQRGKVLDARATSQFSVDQQTTLLEVTDAYFGVLRAGENLVTSEAEERAIARQLEQTKERFDVGLVPITDVHEAQAAYDTATVNTLESKSALNIAFEALEVLTGRAHGQLVGLAESFPVTKPEPLDAESWVTFARENNFALEVARLDMESARRTADIAKAGHAPTVTASIDYQKVQNDGRLNRDGGIRNPTTGLIDPALRQPYVNDLESTVFGINLHVPLYSGGMVSAQRRQAYQQWMSAQENYVLAQRNTTQDARSRHLQVLTDAARIQARRQAVTSAQSALDATQAGYEVGTRNIVDVLISQRTLYQAQRDYANARFDYIDSMLRLREVAAQLGPGDIEQLNRWLDPNLSVDKVGL